MFHSNTSEFEEYKNVLYNNNYPNKMCYIKHKILNNQK